MSPSQAQKLAQLEREVEALHMLVQALAKQVDELRTQSKDHGPRSAYYRD